MPGRCRICLGEREVRCRCACGEASWFHDRCLLSWVRARGPKCEICGCMYRGLHQRAYTCDLDTSKLDLLVVDVSGAVLLMYVLLAVPMWHVLRVLCGAHLCVRICLLGAHTLGLSSGGVGPQGGAAWSIRAICYRVVPSPASGAHD